MSNISNNKEEAAFEAELFNALKQYGYLFPESTQQVEAFEQSHHKLGDAPPIEKILLADTNDVLINFSDLNMGIAAYSNTENEFPQLNDDEVGNSPNNDEN